jgi:hypothetical protein
MTQLSNYFKKEFEASKPGEIFWLYVKNLGYSFFGKNF